MMKINVSRLTKRKKAKFSMEVLTPMFLGGASGDAEVRTPPFRNALRYWWRITQGDIPWEQLLKKEQKLFGGVTEKACRSLVEVVASGKVRTGNVNEKDNLGQKLNTEANNRSVPLSAYLGMGPVHFTGAYTKTRILPGEMFQLSVSFPESNLQEISDALSLFKAFGGLGARSRNGWGSFALHPADPEEIKLLGMTELFSKFGKEISQIFSTDKKYPFRLGMSEGKPLLWETGRGTTWKEAMQTAGEKYMDLRQQDKLTFPKNGSKNIEKRHILGYPVTNHRIQDWEEKKSGRMPSQLRILVRKKNSQYVTLFFHLPHKIPKKWDEKRLGNELEIWKHIHNYLDTNCKRVTGDLERTIK
jgi:CRISPR-associated protein Cmr1